jgi:uncharacterized RDD family membrane protein YckC
MEGLLTFVLACYGLTNIVTNSKLFKPVREGAPGTWLKDLLKCPMCFGFWAGLILAFWFDINPFIGALISSGSSWTIHVVLMRLGACDL